MPRKIPRRLEKHGHIRVDDYYWLRERDTEPVLSYLRQENDRTTEAMRPVAALVAIDPLSL